MTKKVTLNRKSETTIIVSDKVRSYANDPYFVKKAEDAKEFMRKHPLPDHLKK
jgi:hypothetical protein